MAMGFIQPLTPSPPPPPPPPPYTYPPIIIILTIILLVFFFFGLFSIYFCRCLVENILCTWHLRHSPDSTPAGGAALSAQSGGLDPSVVQSFPTFTYSTVKDYRKENYGLECAICLVEFEGSNLLRLLTTCYHVYHQECIDLWLESHKTCPVCRRNLDSPLQSPMKSPDFAVSILDPMQGNNTMEDTFSITIRDDGVEDEKRASEKGQSISSCDGDHAQRKVEKFSRSYSTGHSIVINREEGQDKFTLLLPEHVKIDIVRGHNPSQSWPIFGEYKTRSSTEDNGLAANPDLSREDNKI
ncbi:hypothetical protein OROGR_010577 [Orobanche gracilis]